MVRSSEGTYAMKNEDLQLYLVTGRYDYPLSDFLEIIDIACQNGVTMVQLREKEITTKEYYELALAVKKVTDANHVPLLIDDRVDVCLAIDAAGVHIGDDELPVEVARKLIGPDKILGVSAKSTKRALEAQAAGASYLGVGAVFPTKTKVDPKITSFKVLKEISESADIPVVAIGGIKEENLAAFKDSGITGIAIVSEIMLATDVAKKVKNLKSKFMKVNSYGE